MSYDVNLVIDTGSFNGPTEVWTSNYTYNCSKMFNIASPNMAGINGLDGLLASPQAIIYLTYMIDKMEAEPHYYREMNPPSGWGDYDSALAWLRNILKACQEHVKCKVTVT